MAVKTVVKTVGSGGNYTTLQSWEDDAPADLTTAKQFAAGSFSSSFTQGASLTFTGSGATGKFLDSDGSTYIVFGVTSGTPAAGDVVSDGTASCTLSGTATFTGVIWQGQIKNASDKFSPVGVNPILVVGGSTVNATCYKELTTATGASFRDNVNAQTNPLRYDSTAGCAIEGTAGYVLIFGFGEGFFHTSNIQMQSAVGNSSICEDGWGNGVIDNCIMEATGRIYASRFAGGTKVRNTLLVKRNSNNAPMSHTAASFYNCTIVLPFDKSAVGTKALNRDYTSGEFLENVVICGFDTAINSLTGWTSTNCYTDLTSPGTGWTGGLTYDTTTGSGFQNITDATRDYRIKSTSTLKDAGVTDPTNAAFDIVGTPRPQGSAYDVGAWEFKIAGGGFMPAVGGIAQPNMTVAQ